MSKELKIGEVGIIEGKTVKCVDTEGDAACWKCVFKFNTREQCEDIPCMGIDREDNNGVYFVEVKE